MRFYPMRKPDLKGKRPLKVVYAENTFTRRYIRYINGSVGGLVAISGLSYADSEASRTLFWLQCLLPLGEFLFLFFPVVRSDISITSLTSSVS